MAAGDELFIDEFLAAMMKAHSRSERNSIGDGCPAGTSA
jgi:hypothetical protein